jgi:prepilin-type N-terminal cleavage/methylation domain-containing protein
MKKSIYNQKKLSRDAFTLIEVLVVVAVSAVIATGGFVMFSGYQKNQNIKLTLSELTAAIRDIQKRSVTQENGKQWGIRLSNGTADSFQTWSGLSYASGTPDQTYSLKRNIQFGNPPSGFTTDLIFQAMTGILGEDRVVTVNSGAGALVGDVIINTLGKVTTRVEKGLVGYWHFDEGTSTVAYDASGSGNNGTLTNGPTWQTSTNCKAGGCLDFDGVDDNVSTSTVPNLTGGFSFSVWVKTPILQDASYDSVVSKFSSSPYNGWFLRRSANNSVMYFSLYNGGSAYSVSDSTLVANTWMYYAGTFDGANLKLYVNGVLKGTRTGAVVGNATSNFVIGGNYGGPSETWNGMIDEVRLYNRALSADEVLNIYNDLK